MNWRQERTVAMSSLSRWWASGWSDNKSTKTKFSRPSLGNVSSINVNLTQGPFTNNIHSTDWIGCIYLAKEVVINIILIIFMNLSWSLIATEFYISSLDPCWYFIVRHWRTTTFLLCLLEQNTFCSRWHMKKELDRRNAIRYIHNTGIFICLETAFVL